MPFTHNPQMIDPEQGWIVNWNNKPSAGWNTADHSKWGPTQRVALLATQMAALLDGDGTMELSDLVNVMRIAATQDANALTLGARMLALAPASGTLQEDAKTLLEQWIADGAHRRDRDRDDQQDHGPAVALWDTWLDKLAHRIFDDELGGLYGLVGIKIADDPRGNNGSSYFFDLGNYIWNLLDPDTKGKLAHDFCDDRSTPAIESCDEQVLAAFGEATAELAEMGEDPETWIWPADKIRFTARGAQSIPAQPWQNRGTYNHVIEVATP